MISKKRIWILFVLFSVFIIFLLGSFYYVPEIPSEVLNEKYSVTPSQYIEIDGMNVHYIVEGPPTDTIPLVLIHGTSSSLFTWNRWTEILQDKHRVIRFDLPAFGLTGPHPEGDYRVEAYLSFLKSFLKKLEIKQCILVGNSIGGEIAWRYALNNPKQVHKLVLLNASGYPVELKEVPLAKIPYSFLWLRIPLIRELSVMFITPEVMRESLIYLYGDPKKVTDNVVEVYFDMINRKGNREALTERMESFNIPAPLQEITKIKVPTLIIWGDKDRLIPVEHARRFHNDLPYSTLKILQGAGHMPMEEIPNLSVKPLLEFIKD